jgi:hypothetical protein
MRDAAGPPLDSPGKMPCADGMALHEVRTSVILPAYNEAAALPIVLQALEHVLGPHDEIIVVDDGSTDETASIASHYRCRVIRHSGNRGKGAAVRTGLSAAQGRYIIVMDADATYPTEYLPKIINMLGTYDLVRCPRQYNGDVMPAINRLGNALFSGILRVMHGLRGNDPLTGLFGLRREVLQRIRLRAYGFDLEVEVNVKAQAYGLRQAELPIPYYRRVGEKKLRPIRDGWRILRRVILLALVFNPLLMFVLPGTLLGVTSVLLAAVLSSGPLVVTPYLGFSVHSFIIAALGIPLGFQMILFGLAAALFAVTLGIPPQAWLLRVCHYRTRLILFAIGLLVALVGGGGVIWLSLGWLLGGHGAFTQTELLVLSAVGVLWGMEMIGGALFLSVFSPVLDQDHTAVENIEVPS